MNPLRVLYVGPLWQGSTCTQRLDALSELGHAVAHVDTSPFLVRGSRLLRVVRQRLELSLGVLRLNRLITDRYAAFQPDVVFVDNVQLIWPGTLRRLRRLGRAVLIHRNNDNPFGDGVIGVRTFKRAIPFYDLHLVPRDENIPQYNAAGSPRTERFYPSYNVRVHRPMSLTPDERTRWGGAVGFVGAWESERGRAIARLADSGVSVRVWGPNWHKSGLGGPNLRIEGRCVWGDDYARAICAFDVNLGFLRKDNHDLSTSRSVEIPACGAFFLAERTPEHQDLFIEGVEAEFFGSIEELLDKTRYYVANPSIRQRIAAKGRERCIQSGYGNVARMEQMLSVALSSVPA